MYWQSEAKRIVCAELTRRDVTYEKLAQCLRKNGIPETKRSLANKISRGTFSFVFFLQVMRALGVKNFSVEATEFVPGLRYTGGAESAAESHKASGT